MISDAESGISVFDSSISVNTGTIASTQAASDNLLNTDFAEESVLYTQATANLNAAISILLGEQQRLQSVVRLVNF